MELLLFSIIPPWIYRSVKSVFYIKLNSNYFCGKVKHELRVQIHELRVQIHELQVQIYELRVQIQELRAQIHELRIQIHELED